MIGATAMRKSIRGCRRLAGAVAAGLIAITGSSHAHQQWVSPNFVYQSGESAWLSFDHTFGDRRFQPGSGPSSYYSWWIVGPDGFKRNVPNLFLGRTRTVGEIELSEPGTYRIEAVEDRMPWTQIKVDGKNLWQPGTRADFDGFDIERSIVYFNKSATYVTLGSVSHSLLSGTGDPLEIVFEDHPNDLYEGKEFEVRVLASGEPLANQEVRVFSDFGEGHDASATCNTNANGSCDLSMPAPGRYLLATNQEGTSPSDADTDGFSHGYTVLIELKPTGAASAASGE